MRSALFNCSLKNLGSRGPVAFPESRFQYVKVVSSRFLTVSLCLALNHQTPPPLPPSPPPQAWHTQQFSALVAKHTLRHCIESYGDCFTGNKGDEPDTNISENDSGIGFSDDKVYN